MTSLDHAAGALPAGAVTADSAALPVPPFRGTSLPDIDYASHPAYGGTFQPSTARERLQALVTFLRSFAFVTFRRIVDYDNMPLLSKEVGGGRLTPAIAARYMVIFPRLRIGRILRSLLGQRRAAVPANRALCDRLFSDGIACLRLSEEEIEAVRRVTAPGFAKLDRRRMEISLEKRKFDDNVYWCTRSADPQAFEAIERIFRRHGITDAASAYLGRPVGVKHINPQINEENYAFWKRLFADTKVPDPWTSYLHVDATYGMLKGAIYIHDIGPDNGPFCYVRASHRAKVGGFEGLIRRTNDFCGFSGRRPEARRKFMALPRVLRKKADFGGDVLDSSPDATCLKEGHLAVTSDYGNCVVFDGKGIHRGGMVNKGERRCVFIVLAEI